MYVNIKAVYLVVLEIQTPLESSFDGSLKFHELEAEN